MSDLDPINPETADMSAPPPPTLAAPDPITIPPQPTFRSLLFGDDGLRAGWSVLLFLLLVLAVGATLVFVARHFHLLPKQPPAGALLTPHIAAVGETMQLLFFLIPALFMSLIERRPFACYGLGARRMIPDFLTGLFWGFLALGSLVGTLYLVHGIAFDGVLLNGMPAFLYAAKWGAVFFLVGLAEEFIFRGYLLYTTARGVSGIVRSMNPQNRYSHQIGFWIAAGIFSILLFMLGHLSNGGENYVGIFQVGLVGAVFAFSLYRTGSLWWAIGAHTAWDWAQSFFFGTPDSGNLVAGHLIATHPLGSRLLSGGPDGPEGSLLGIPTLLLLAVVIHLTLPKRDYPLTPDQSPLP